MTARYSLVGLMMVVSCASPKPDTAAPALAAPAPAAQSQDADQQGSAEAALLTADPLVVDGQSYPVYLDAAKILHVGTATMAVDHIDPASNDYHWNRQARLSVANFAEGQPAVILATPTSDAEDPPNRYQIFLVDDKGLERVFDQVIGAYNVQPVELPGDGTIRYQEDGWTACDRLEHPEKATMQTVIFRLDPQSGQAVEAERKDTTDVMICDQLAG